MKPVILTDALSAADRSPVLLALASFAGKSADEWLPDTHPVQAGQLPTSWAAVKALPRSALRDAVAVAGPNHCIDGWSFASRSLSALVAGDYHTSRHLAYYAQLRAGLSILANLGVGIFNGINYVVRSDGSVVRLDSHPPGFPNKRGLGTHDVVWDALSLWSSGPDTSRLFLDLVRVRGSTLRECLGAVWPGFATVGAATTLINAWGVDLRRGKDEHRSRNISSYNPQMLNRLSLACGDSWRFMASFWQLFEPSGAGGFDNIDKFLLRSLLQKQHRIVTGNSRYRHGAIATRYDELPSRVRSLASSGFLSGTVQNTTPDLLRGSTSTTNPAKPTEMLSRAFLLLRTATAFTHSSFVDAGLDATTDLRPWLDQWAADRGFWPPNAPLDDPLDLWGDVEWALAEFEDSVSPTPASLSEWLRGKPNGLPTIFETERIAMWSLCA